MTDCTKALKSTISQCEDINKKQYHSFRGPNLDTTAARPWTRHGRSYRPVIISLVSRNPSTLPSGLGTHHPSPADPRDLWLSGQVNTGRSSGAPAPRCSFHWGLSSPTKDKGCQGWPQVPPGLRLDILRPGEGCWDPEGAICPACEGSSQLAGIPAPLGSCLPPFQCSHLLS